MKKIYVGFGIIIVFAFVLVIFYLYFLNYYPKKYENIISEYSKKYALDESLVFSIIKVESGFDDKAISNSDARGLMQLKFETAKEIADKLEIENFNIEDLFNAKINIEFGCFYLRYLLNYYGNNYKFAICAYNAGLGNVDKWIEHYKNDYIIEFKETNDYYKNVLSSQKIYKNFYGIT